MRTLKPLQLLLLVAGMLSLMTCKKPEDNVFKGSARIRGTIYFANYLSGTTDTAKTANLTLVRSDQLANQYVINLTNGTFDIQSLTSGVQYSMTVQFDYRQPGSSKTDHYQKTQIINPLGFNEFKDQDTIVMPLQATGTATMKVNVIDGNNAAVLGAQVCLYSDAATLLTNQGNCNGSLATATTNADGNAVFYNLQQISYYVAVNATIGGKLYTNLTATPKPVSVSQSINITHDNETLSVSGNTLQFLLQNANGTPLPGVSLCLYDDPSILAKYRGTCTASLNSSSSNAQGIVTFNGLLGAHYYASAYIVSGSDTLSNLTKDQTAYTPNYSGTPVTTLKLMPNIQASFTALSVTVTDQYGANMSNATVSLYSDHTLLVKYRGSTTGSLYSGTTNASGVVTFTGLQKQPINYYISAYKALNSTDTLSNKTDDQIPKSITPNQTVSYPVTIK